MLKNYFLTLHSTKKKIISTVFFDQEVDSPPPINYSCSRLNANETSMALVYSLVAFAVMLYCKHYSPKNSNADHKHYFDEKD